MAVNYHHSAHKMFIDSRLAVAGTATEDNNLDPDSSGLGLAALKIAIYII
jgi:hypothetical protein